MADRELSEGERLKYFFETQKARYEKCLEPTMQCQNKTIRAHSIQNANVFDLLETDGHLIMPRPKFSKDGPKIEFSMVGRNMASTFTGLCGDHDREIFRPIDSKKIDINDLEQRFLLAYRSVTRELHAVLEGAMKIQASYNWKVEKGLLPGDEPTEEGIIATHHMMLAWETWRYRYKYFDEAYLKSKWKDLRHKVFVLEDQRAIIPLKQVSGFPYNKCGRETRSCPRSLLRFTQRNSLG